LAWLVALALTGPSVLSAQNVDQRLPSQPLPEFDRQVPARDDVPAHVAIVDGAASLERDGRREALEENTLLLAGDRLRTERGRVEVLFDDGSVLDIDEFTSMDLLSDSLVRLTAGRLRLAIARVTNTLTYRVDAAGTTSWIQNAGEYRIAIKDARDTNPEVELSVFRGLAELETPHGRTRVRTGAQAFAVATSAPSQTYAVNVAIVDDFDRWTEHQRDARLGVDSPQYLPSELRQYGGALDDAGTWGYEADYGAVWYPRVDVGWRPYYQGRWGFYGSFGWTWVGGPRWAWPTHHYGRWGYSNKWYWIPGRRWAPAYVSWGYYPGYVSWCPLGYSGYPVYPITYTNYFTVQPWVAWTVVPSRTFVHNFHPASYVVAQPTIAQPVWSQFAVRNAGPVGPVNTGSRTAPLRSPTYSGQAVLRNSPPSTPPEATTGNGVVPQWRSGVDADGTTRVRPDGSAPNRVAPSSATALQPDRATGPSRTRASTPIGPEEPSGMRSVMPTPLTTEPFTRAAGSGSGFRRPDGGSAVRRSDPPRAPSIDPVENSRPVMPEPSRTPSRTSGFYRNDQPPAGRGRVYGSPAGEPPPAPEPRGMAVPRGTAVPRSAPAAGAGGVERGAPSGTPAGPSRVQPRTAPSGPPSPPPNAAPPPPAAGSRTAPPASGGRGQAVPRSGGGGGR
jgi:hypothetical protein